MRLFAAAALLTGVVLLAAGASFGETRTPQGGGLRLVRVAGGFASPTHVAAVRGEPGRLYVVEKRGRIWLLVGGKRRRLFLDIRSQVESSGSEQGLFSIAFHPSYARNHLFYVDYTDRSGDTRVVEYRARTGRRPVRVRQLLFVDQPFSNHNGGQLVFGPDGLLYVGMGDGGSQDDPGNRAQNLSILLGKLLTIDVGNPNPLPRIVAYGLRNPWRFDFDRRTGDLWLADVGQRVSEEVDFLAAGTSELVNFGWDVFEGNDRHENKEPNPAGRLVFPLTTYGHDGGNCSITGGFVYRGNALPAVRGRYFYGDYCSGAVWSLRRAENGQATGVRREPFTVPLLSSFGEGAGGELYLVSLQGVIYRLASR